MVFNREELLYLSVVFLILVFLAAYTLLSSVSKFEATYPETTVINGTSYEIYRLKPGEILVKNDVAVIPIHPLTTGCHGDSYLLLFPDLTKETLGINWVCTGVRLENKSIVFTKHTYPRAGLMVKNDKLFLLVSSEGNISEEWGSKAIRSGNWVIVVFYSRNGVIRYSLVYTGDGFLAESTMLPPTPGEILLAKQNSNKKILFSERGLCPWIRKNMTYIYSGYTYSYQIDYLKNNINSGEKYKISINAHCVFNKIILSNNTMVPSTINITLNFNLET